MIEFPFFNIPYNFIRGKLDITTQGKKVAELLVEIWSEAPAEYEGFKKLKHFSHCHQISHYEGQLKFF